ncbi:hypothetical protein D0Z67_14680 [Streptomyces seoulensis]|uniref:Uncharacterized protein n=2 Tax=Streptomyces seoulensis TaxID=73044 RepID=A0A4P6U0A6_STRSO|nr:hypothetical protein D0Z67_14680 [Streptomyces seoulensis]
MMRRGLRNAVRGLCAGTVVWALAGTPAMAAPDGYAFTPGAENLAGSPDTAGARTLVPGHTYRSSLPARGRLYYRLTLDATANVYVPVTAVPPRGATVAATDGIRVSLQDADGNPCFYSSASFGAGLSPRPVTAVGQRDTGRSLCQSAAVYYLLVERLDAKTSDPGRWDLELAPATEPGLAATAPTTPPRSWNSATPQPPGGAPRERRGGEGFSAARVLGQGVWRTRLAPGDTAFYKVPVDWGRQVHASAELAAATGHGYVGGALTLSLLNPARGPVDDAALGYTGTRHGVSLAPVPPVEYANRYAVPSGENGVRFAGDYYLVLHLSDRLADSFGTGPFGVTLRVRLDGTAHAGPKYLGRTEPTDLLAVSPGDWGPPASGDTGGTDPAMRALAYGGLGAGTALLLGLGAWALLARRSERAAGARKPTA